VTFPGSATTGLMYLTTPWSGRGMHYTNLSWLVNGQGLWHPSRMREVGGVASPGSADPGLMYLTTPWSGQGMRHTINLS
jgi:hypothetical protein